MSAHVHLLVVVMKQVGTGWKGFLGPLKTAAREFTVEKDHSWHVTPHCRYCEIWNFCPFRLQLYPWPLEECLENSVCWVNVCRGTMKYY